MKKRKRLVAAQLVTICLICLAEASAQTAPVCTSFTVVTQDKLNNIKEGLSADDAKWFREKIEKQYSVPLPKNSGNGDALVDIS